VKREFYLKQAKKVDNLILILFLFSVLYYGCDEGPKVERSKLVKVYVEKTIAQSQYSDNPVLLDSAKQAIFQKYNLTEEQYKTAIEGIEPNSEYWNAFFKEAKTYLDSIKIVPKKNEPLSQE
jgi:hypothetical protein